MAQREDGVTFEEAITRARAAHVVVKSFRQPGEDYRQAQMGERPEHFRRGNALPKRWPSRSWFTRKRFSCPVCHTRYAWVHDCKAWDSQFGNGSPF